MRVLVTGAAGRVGSETVRLLHAGGHDVIATDVAPRNPIPVQLHQVNLLDRAAVATLVDAVDAIVHLGNHIGPGRTRPAAQTFSENVAMNMNVFQPALERRVKRVIFASSVQAFASVCYDGVYPPHAVKVDHLPFDSHVPANPANSYALSKSVGETMLQQYLAPHGIVCAAMRFPQLFDVKQIEDFRHFRLDEDHSPVRIAQGFSVLSNRDAAASVVAVLQAELSGFHTFFPALSQVAGPLVKPAIERYYRDVPLRRPVDQIDSLIDISELTQATGWRPRDSL